MTEKDDLEQLDGKAEAILKRRITRRQAIKAGGIAAVGLVFSKPLIETIRPKPAFANYHFDERDDDGKDDDGKDDG